LLKIPKNAKIGSPYLANTKKTHQQCKYFEHNVGCNLKYSLKKYIGTNELGV